MGSEFAAQGLAWSCWVSSDVLGTVGSQKIAGNAAACALGLG